MVAGEKLLDELAGFSGTEQYHRWSRLYPQCVLTDGALHLAEQAACFWLMDIVGSYQSKLLSTGEYFQNWTVTKLDNGSAFVVCDDGNGHALVRQGIPYTDFPLWEYSFYAIYDGEYLVVLLKGEY